MVFTTTCTLMREFAKKVIGPDRFWKRRKILRLSAHFYGRKQNCYTIALRSVIRALTNATKERTRKHEVLNELHVRRLEAACEEHGFAYPYLKESLIRSNILLNKKMLSELAIWEPRTFKCITDFAWNKAKSENLKGIDKLGNPPEGVILKPTPIDN